MVKELDQIAKAN